MVHYGNFKDAIFFLYHLLEARYQNLATGRKKQNVKHTLKKRKKFGVETQFFGLVLKRCVST